MSHREVIDLYMSKYISFEIEDVPTWFLKQMMMYYPEGSYHIEYRRRIRKHPLLRILND